MKGKGKRERRGWKGMERDCREGKGEERDGIGGDTKGRDQKRKGGRN